MRDGIYTRTPLRRHVFWHVDMDPCLGAGVSFQRHFGSMSTRPLGPPRADIRRRRAAVMRVTAAFALSTEADHLPIFFFINSYYNTDATCYNIYGTIAVHVVSVSRVPMSIYSCT
jgi:hypothetical protein